jgi:hypothetical protein
MLMNGRLCRSLQVTIAGIAAALAMLGLPGALSQAASPAPAAAGRLVASALPDAGFPLASVSGVSCVSNSSCFAAGTGTILHGRTRLTSNTGLLWRYDGRSWRLSTRLRVPQSGLLSISCVTRSFCMAVGRAGNPTSRVLAERWNGRAWSPVKAASPRSSGNGDSLAGVDCLSRTDCWAVGGINLGETAGRLSHQLVEHFNGRAFTPAFAPNTGNALTAVSCAGAHSCWALGYSRVLLRLAGRAWRLAQLPGSFKVSVAALSCRTLAACWVVGSHVANGVRPAALHLVGGRWRSVAMPSPQNPDAFLQGLDCASASDCWAVGANGLLGPGLRPPFKMSPFAEQWDGSAWQIASVTGSPASQTSGLFTISCPSSSFCAAGGQHGTTADTDPLVATTPLG